MPKPWPCASLTGRPSGPNAPLCGALIDDWETMGSDQRKRLLATVFEEIVVGADGVAELLPREGWRPYLKAALESPRVLAERKTGVKHAEVITARLLQDERGWLRLAG